VAVVGSYCLPFALYVERSTGASVQSCQAALQIMKNVCTVLLAGAGLLNIYPLVGVLSADYLTGLYGSNFESPDIQTLMRHRAVMLGLIGGLMLFAAFRSSLQLLAATVGLVSMSSFVFLAYSSGEIGPEINKVAIADIVGAVAVAIVLVIVIRDRRSAT
jgi:hypothetical protein